VGHPVLPRPPVDGDLIWVFILALPLQLVGEFLGDVLWKNRVSHFVEQKTAAKSFSVLRILYGFLLVSVTIALLLGAGYGWQALRSCLGLTFP